MTHAYAGVFYLFAAPDRFADGVLI